MQQSYNTAKMGASKTFANYYGGTGDTRTFVHTAKPIPPIATSLDRLGEDYDRTLAVSVRNRNRARHLAEGLAGQKNEYLRELIFGKKTRGKFENLRTWPMRAREALELEEISKRTGDSLRELFEAKYTLPGYFQSWVSKTKSLNPKLLGVAARVSSQRDARTKQEVMNRAKQIVARKYSLLKRIAEGVYEAKRAELMTAMELERDGAEGGFFSQVGTNLYATESAKKLMASAKKSPPKKVYQDQQTSPMSAMKSKGTPSSAKSEKSAKKSSLPLEPAIEMFKRVSTKALTPAQDASLKGRFRAAGRLVHQGAAMMGLADPPDNPVAKRKLLVTPGSTPNQPA
jgi:hypothetical protein